MTPLDGVGSLAAGLVLATFWAKSMVSLRVLAIASNVCFAIYAFGAKLWLILLLHALMFPLNLFRLSQAFGNGLQAHAERSPTRRTPA